MNCSIYSDLVFTLSERSRLSRATNIIGTASVVSFSIENESGEEEREKHVVLPLLSQENGNLLEASLDVGYEVTVIKGKENNGVDRTRISNTKQIQSPVSTHKPGGGDPKEKSPDRISPTRRPIKRLDESVFKGTLVKVRALDVMRNKPMTFAHSLKLVAICGDWSASSTVRPPWGSSILRLCLSDYVLAL